MTVQVDVLVLGAGAAGIRAAIAARDEGAQVLIVSKGAFGKSGSSFYPLSPGWGIQASAPETPEDSPDVHLADVLEAAQGVCRPELARILTAEAPDRIRELQAWGLPFEKHEDGSYVRVRGCFSSRERCFQVSGVRAIARAFRSQLERRGVRILEHHMAVRLVLDENGECRGAIVANREGKVELFLASATVLATGGAGQLFRWNLNTQDITGDGQALALEAGAAVENMEFFQIGMGIVSPLKRGLFLDRVFIFNPPLRDHAGHEILPSEIPAPFDPADCLRIRGYHYPFTSRYISRYVDYAIYKRLLAGEKSILVDLGGVPKEELIGTPLARIWYEWLLEAGFDPQSSPLEITLCAHAFNGGLCIDEEGWTGVPRLFAAGEVAAGPHGADRPGGNMHAACQVFGARAGRAAAATPAPQKWEDFSRLLNQMEGEINALLRRDSGLSVEEAHRRLQRAMWENVLVARDSESLNQALEEINALRERSREFYLARPGHLYMALALRNMLTVGEIIVRAAALRRESRGSHWRVDFPFLDPRFNGRFAFRLENGELKYSVHGAKL